MKQGYKYLGMGVIGVLSVTALSSLFKSRYTNSTSSSVEHAGKPDQLPEENQALIENAKMVSEGSQFGVQYYNNLKQ